MQRACIHVDLPGGVDLGYAELSHGYARVYVYDRPFRRLAPYTRGERIGLTRADGVWRRCER